MVGISVRFFKKKIRNENCKATKLTTQKARYLLKPRKSGCKFYSSPFYYFYWNQIGTSLTVKKSLSTERTGRFINIFFRDN